MISPVSQGGPNIALITIACGWTFVGFALLGISLLLWSRQIKRIPLSLDDLLTTLALLTSIVLMAQTTWAIVWEGEDDHEAKISRQRFALVVRSLLINQTLWGVVNTLVRSSAILIIKRVFGLKWITWLLFVGSILYGLVVFLEIFLICRPMAVDWNAHIGGTCGNQIVSYLVLEILGLFLDFAILIIPIPCIWRLEIKLARKMSIASMFLIGALIFIISGLRLQALRMVNAEDFTYSKGYLGLLSALGASLGITFCCASAVPVVYHHCRPQVHKYPSHINEKQSAVFHRIKRYNMPNTSHVSPRVSRRASITNAGPGPSNEFDGPSTSPGPSNEFDDPSTSPGVGTDNLDYWDIVAYMNAVSPKLLNSNGST